MSDGPTGGGFHIDSDWKEEAAQEKARLAEQEKQQRQKEQVTGGTTAEAGAGAGAATFVELINLLAMQAMVGLGGFQGPRGERIPPNPAVAKHHIDLLEILQKKTEGNLTDEEKLALDGVLYELRMQYVQAATVPPPSGQEKEKK